jgi:outer membrane protein assembly factor BamB/tetratricopeptide (TPR) repeat protein
LAARGLSRLGFADEAEATARKGQALVETHGTPTQRARARINAAWVDLDHGDADDAAAAFASVADLAGYVGGDLEEASRLASHARALFHMGHSARAIQEYERAIELAGDAAAPRFLAHLAFAEGATMHGIGEAAVDAADQVLAIVESEMPTWRNVGHLTAARANRVAGNAEAAADHLQRAMELTPDGIDGIRIRLRCEVERLHQLPAGTRWPKADAARLTDALLQASWYSFAAELMGLRAQHEKGTDWGAQAVALASRLGSPLLAANAAEAAGSWDKPEGALAARMVRDADEHVADVWRDAWESNPVIVSAKAVTDEADADAVDARLEDALSRAGLVGAAASPAQRAAEGLQFQGRRTARGWLGPILGVAAAAVAVVALVIALQPNEVPPPPQATAPPPTTTTIPILAEPEFWPGGTYVDRGGPAGTGVTLDGGIASADGWWWPPVAPGGETQASVVADGQRLFFASSTRDEVTMLSQATGEESWQKPVPGRMLVSLAVGQIGLEGAPSTYVVWATENGTVGAFNDQGTEVWRKPPDELPGRSDSAPVIADVMYPGDDEPTTLVFVTREVGNAGLVAALRLDSGEIVWRSDEARTYEAEVEGVLQEVEDPPLELDPVTTSVSVSDDVLVLAPNGSRLYYLDARTGAVLCEYLQTTGNPSRPVITDGSVIVPGDGRLMGLFPFPTCSPTGLSTLQWDIEFPTSAAAIGTEVYFVTNGGLIGIDFTKVEQGLDTEGDQPEKLWDIVNPTDGSSWVTSPVIAGPHVIVGSDTGEIAGVDRTTGQIIWTWTASGEIMDEVTPVKGAVFATTAEGRIVAIGGPRVDEGPVPTTTTTEAASDESTTTTTAPASEGATDDGSSTTTTEVSADDVAGGQRPGSSGRG